MKTTSPLNYYQALNLCADKSGQTFREWMNSPFIAALINKINGKGTWEKNPFVWVYDFRLIEK